MSVFVGLPACVREIEPGRPFHAVNEMYVTAVRDFAHCQPMIFPALGLKTNFDALLDRLDGLLLTGSPSNVDPVHYGEDYTREPKADPARDATTLPIIEKALDRGLPILAICRGLQEMNVALGGNLHQRIREVRGRFVHHEDKNQPLEVRYGPAHSIALTEGGFLSNLLDSSQIMVNSLHGQGVNQLAPRAKLDAAASDGTVEAFTVDGAPGFTLAVQWHPEYRPDTNPASVKIFEAFGNACRAYAQNG